MVARDVFFFFFCILFFFFFNDTATTEIYTLSLHDALPISRCDLGGRMHVSDVIQTGIIGSIVLCLPNAKEGIMIPVCLSGIQARLDSYLSILKSESSCLQRSEEHTSELQSHSFISYAVFCLKKKNKKN